MRSAELVPSISIGLQDDPYCAEARRAMMAAGVGGLVCRETGGQWFWSISAGFSSLGTRTYLVVPDAEWGMALRPR